MMKVWMLSLVLAVAALCGASPAAAQSSRTYVSSVGDDFNPCSETAPCRTFAAAIAATSAGGVVNCQDAAGYGAATITKALTIDCHFTEGGVLASGTGVTVNAGTSDVVVIRGLDLHGVAGAADGIRIQSASGVFVENCRIDNFNSAGSFGIHVQPSAPTALYVVDTTLSGNGNATSGGAIGIQPTGVAFARVNITHSQILHNLNYGIFADTTGTTGYLPLMIEDSTVSGNGTGVQLTAPGGAAYLYAVLNRVSITNQTGSGLSGDGTYVNARAVNSLIALNRGTGVLIANAANIFSYGDNVLDYNSVSGAFVSTVPKH